MSAESDYAAFLAGWNPADGPCPNTHSLPPAIDPGLGHNGVAGPIAGDADYPWAGLLAPVLTDMVAAVINEHWANVGWREGPNNDNPWGAEMGLPNSPYCDEAACTVAYHHGYRWPADSQCGEHGTAYTVYHVEQGLALGEVRYDHTSAGDPADVQPLDMNFYAWTPGATTPDHVETAIEARIGAGRCHNVGYNTGSPEGCWETWRDERYFLCRLRPLGYYLPTPPAPPPPNTDPLNTRGRLLVPFGGYA